MAEKHPMSPDYGDAFQPRQDVIASWRIAPVTGTLLLDLVPRFDVLPGSVFVLTIENDLTLRYSYTPPPVPVQPVAEDADTPAAGEAETPPSDEPVLVLTGAEALSALGIALLPNALAAVDIDEQIPAAFIKTDTPYDPYRGVLIAATTGLNWHTPVPESECTFAPDPDGQFGKATHNGVRVYPCPKCNHYIAGPCGEQCVIAPPSPREVGMSPLLARGYTTRAVVTQEDTEALRKAWRENASLQIPAELRPGEPHVEPCADPVCPLKGDKRLDCNRGADCPHVAS